MLALLSLIVSVLALFVSIASAYFSWQANSLKNEALSFAVEPLSDCRVEYRKLMDRGELGICWFVIITNQSESRLSIINREIYNVRNGALVTSPSFSAIDDESGSPARFPIVLDGGEGRRFIVRTPVEIPPAVARVIDELPETAAGTLSKMAMMDLMSRLAEARIDFIGNALELMREDGKIVGWTIKPPIKSTSSYLKVETGRRKAFLTRFVWPPGSTPE